jgi:hypothetical protein
MELIVMKTSIKLLGASVLMLAASTAFADPAAVINDFGCSGFVPDENGDVLEWITTEKSHSVETGSGISKMTCHFDHGVDLPQAYGAQGFVCGVFVDGIVTATTDSMMLATPGGQAVLVCKLKVVN